MTESNRIEYKRELTNSLECEQDDFFVGYSMLRNKTLMRVSEIAADTLKGNPSIRYVTLSGPTFARDVAMEQPTTAVVAGHDTDAARTAQHLLNSHRFRVYLNSDHIGVELGANFHAAVACHVPCREHCPCCSLWQ